MMTNFNWIMAKERGIKSHQQRNKTLSKCADKHWKAKHPDWCRDASQNNFTQLNKVTKEKEEKYQMINENRRKKLLGL